MKFSLYGLLIGVGVVVGASVSSWMLEKKGEDGRVIWEALWWILVPGILGARIYHVVDWWVYYVQDVGKILEIWEGGMGILGGILGGVLGLISFSIFKARKENTRVEETFFSLADVVVMGVTLAQSVGRWGNYFNGELYGRRTELPWGIWIPGLEGKYHPLFLYESVLNLILFIILFFVYRSKEGRGSTFGSYLIGYGLIRLVLEGLRVDIWRVGEVAVAQVVSLLFIILGILVLRRRQVPIYEENSEQEIEKAQG